MKWKKNFFGYALPHHSICSIILILGFSMKAFFLQRIFTQPLIDKLDFCNNSIRQPRTVFETVSVSIIIATPARGSGWAVGVKITPSTWGTMEESWMYCLFYSIQVSKTTSSSNKTFNRKRSNFLPFFRYQNTF